MDQLNPQNNSLKCASDLNDTTWTTLFCPPPGMWERLSVDPTLEFTFHCNFWVSIYKMYNRQIRIVNYWDMIYVRDDYGCLNTLWYHYIVVNFLPILTIDTP